MNLVAIGQWLEPEGSLDEDVELDNSPGSIFRYRPGSGKPEPVSFPNLPASFENEIQTLLNEFTAISGVSELSRYSQAPSGVKSGVALSIANEQDNTRISNTASNLAQCIKLMGKQWLRLYRQFVQEPRVLRTVGRDKDVEVSDWTVSQLKSDDVIIENSSALAETPAQRRQMVFDMLTAGLFNREETSPISNAAREKYLRCSNMATGKVARWKCNAFKSKRRSGKICDLNKHSQPCLMIMMMMYYTLKCIIV